MPLIWPVGRTLITAPAKEPVSITDMRDQSRIDNNSEDGLLQTLVKVGRRTVEERSGRALITQMWDVKFEGFPDSDEALSLPLPPLQSVESVSYVDAQGNSQTLDASDYQVDTTSEPGRIAPARGTSWPDTDDETLAAATIRIKAGYGDNASDVPEELRQAILLIGATLYENRENVVTGTIVTEIPGTASALISLHHVRPMVA